MPNISAMPRLPLPDALRMLRFDLVRLAVVYGLRGQPVPEVRLELSGIGEGQLHMAGFKLCALPWLTSLSLTVGPLTAPLDTPYLADPPPRCTHGSRCSTWKFLPACTTWALLVDLPALTNLDSVLLAVRDTAEGRLHGVSTLSSLRTLLSLQANDIGQGPTAAGGGGAEEWGVDGGEGGGLVPPLEGLQRVGWAHRYQLGRRVQAEELRS
jgi:hypothetical protein